MLFGKSLFQSVVDRLSHEAESDPLPPGDSGQAFRIRGFASSFVAGSSAATANAADRSADAYLRTMEEFQPDPPAATEAMHAPDPTPPDWIDRLTLEEIAADLGLKPDDDRATLLDKRRAFARFNHPDRIDQRFAEAATTRMKIANLLIDEALRTART